jgi:hypothetical protein
VEREYEPALRNAGTSQAKLTIASRTGLLTMALGQPVHHKSTNVDEFQFRVDREPNPDLFVVKGDCV